MGKEREREREREREMRSRYHEGTVPNLARRNGGKILSE